MKIKVIKRLGNGIDKLILCEGKVSTLYSDGDVNTLIVEVE